MPTIATRPCPAETRATLEQAGLAPTWARLYAARGVTHPDQVTHRLPNLLPPAGLQQIDRAAALLADAIAANKRLLTFAACPYRFLLYALHKLAPREVPVAIKEMDPLQKGSLVHDVLFHVITRLSEAGVVPLTPACLAAAREHLDAVVVEVAARHHEELAPAIERVCEDGIAQVRADLSEWLRREAEDGEGWTPERFELSFGLKQRERQDPACAAAPVALDCGLRLRGAIDLVETHATRGRRVTDFKTGRDRTRSEMVIGGGVPAAGALRPGPRGRFWVLVLVHSVSRFVSPFLLGDHIIASSAYYLTPKEEASIKALCRKQREMLLIPVSCGHTRSCANYKPPVRTP